MTKHFLGAMTLALVATSGSAQVATPPPADLAAARHYVQAFAHYA
jgi:hypothetical protein